MRMLAVENFLFTSLSVVCVQSSTGRVDYKKLFSDNISEFPRASVLKRGNSKPIIRK